MVTADWWAVVWDVSSAGSRLAHTSHHLSEDITRSVATDHTHVICHKRKLTSDVCTNFPVKTILAHLIYNNGQSTAQLSARTF